MATSSKMCVPDHINILENINLTEKLLLQPLVDSSNTQPRRVVNKKLSNLNLGRTRFEALLRKVAKYLIDSDLYRVLH